MARREPVAIVLLNLGGPDTLDAVRPFLYNLFSDRRIIRLGPLPFMQKPIAWMIAKRRAPKTISYYTQIGGGSPIVPITRSQADALSAQLGGQGDFKVTVGMRYWHPFIHDAVDQAVSSGVRRFIGLSLYPHWSIATSGSAELALREALSKHHIEPVIVPAWYDHPLYIEALADRLASALADAPASHILFSAHSLPQSLIDGGDPYVEHIMGTIRAVMARFKGSPWSISYQSRSGPVRWLSPSTGDELHRLASTGVKDILMVPISFVSDHIETLYEIDILYRQMAGVMGVSLRRTESLNVHPKFIGALAGLAIKTAKECDWA